MHVSCTVPQLLHYKSIKQSVIIWTFHMSHMHRVTFDRRPVAVLLPQTHTPSPLSVHPSFRPINAIRVAVKTVIPSELRESSEWQNPRIFQFEHWIIDFELFARFGRILTPLSILKRKHRDINSIPLLARNLLDVCVIKETFLCHKAYGSCKLQANNNPDI